MKRKVAEVAAAVLPPPSAEIPPALLLAFRAHLLREEYSPATVRTYGDWVKLLYPQPDLHRTTPRSRVAAKAAWNAFRGFHASAPPLIDAPSSSDRVRVARSLDRADWLRLRTFLLQLRFAAIRSMRACWLCA